MFWAWFSVSRLRKIIANLEDEKSVLTTEWNHMKILVEQVWNKLARFSIWK